MLDKSFKSEDLLSADQCIRDAIEHTGLSDFGDRNIEQRLHRLLEGVMAGVRFKDGGVESLQSSLRRLLVNRLRMQDDIKRYPEILEQEIVCPIIILGLPRTGTTKLQRMISDSPDVQKLAVWRMFNPAPFPGAEPGMPDPRVTAMISGEKMIDEANQADAMNAAHKMGMNDAEEETILLEFFIDPSVLGFSPYFPLFFYDKWLGGTEERSTDMQAYEYVRTLIKYLQWQDKDASPLRPWIMKSPGHTAHLRALTNMYPDATFVQSHRDPCTVVPSVCKYLTSIWEQTCEIDKKSVGQEIHNWLYQGKNRLLAAREKTELDERIIDVSYKDVRASGIQVIEEIFSRNGKELSPQARSAMLNWEKNNEQGKHGKNVYSLEEFGLDEAEIRTDFADYYDRFSAYI